MKAGSVESGQGNLGEVKDENRRVMVVLRVARHANLVGISIGTVLDISAE